MYLECGNITSTLQLPFSKQTELKYFWILSAETKGVLLNRIEHKYTFCATDLVINSWFVIKPL